MSSSISDAQFYAVPLHRLVDVAQGPMNVHRNTGAHTQKAAVGSWDLRRLGELKASKVTLETYV